MNNTVVNEGTLVTNGVVEGRVVWGEDDIIGWIEVEGMRYLVTISWRLLDGWEVVK